MMNNKWKTILAVMYFTTIISCIEPITMSLGALGIGGGAVVFKYGKTLYCKFKECCRDDWINYNISKLDKVLEQKLIGQHLVRRIIPQTIKAHVKKENPDKALVLSFHGWTGSGKNYVAEIIASLVYKKGVDSKYVYRFIAGHDFPYPSRIEQYKDKLREIITEQTKKCERAMFIFDEMEKMPPGLADVLKPFLDHYPSIRDVNYRKNIFVFLSNIAGSAINVETLSHFKSGSPRESITIKKMQSIISINSFNMEGGLKDSNLILAGLVDFFVPFLPMERKHIKKCVRAEMQRRNQTIIETIVDKVSNELEYFPKDEELFSTTGCKRVAKNLDAAETND